MKKRSIESIGKRMAQNNSNRHPGKLSGIGLQFFAAPNQNPSRLEEIEARLAAIPSELEKEGADLDALKTEVTNLKAERQKIMDAEEQRKKILDEIRAGGGVVVRRLQSQEKEGVHEITPETEEYRSLWLRKLQGKELNEAEKRAYDKAGGAISVMTANSIMSVVRDHAPILERMTVLYSAANISYYVEGTNNDAEDHTENAAITAAADTLTKVDLSPTEIVKLIQVSEAAKVMSVTAFESWLAKTLGEAIARLVNKKIIDALMSAASKVGTGLTSSDVQLLLGSVKGDGVAIICNRKTLFTKLLPLQDNSKSSIVRFDGGAATVYGVDVLVDDNVADDKVLAGDLTKAIAAMPEQVTVRNSYDIDTNSHKYLGVTLFDVKVGLNSAFAKIEAGG